MERVPSTSGRLEMVAVTLTPVQLMASLPVSTPSLSEQQMSMEEKPTLMSSVPQKWP